MANRLLDRSPDEEQDTAVCWLCRTLFAPAKEKAGHLCNHHKTGSIDLVSYGVLYASKLIEKGDHFVVERHSANAEKSSASMFKVVRKLMRNNQHYAPRKFPAKWARRPARGKGQGTRYIDPFKPMLYDLFMAGEANKKHRKNPAQMLEVLQRANPGALDLPEHGEIASFIGSLVARAKKGKTGLPRARPAPVPEALQRMVEELDTRWSAPPKHQVKKNGKLKPFVKLDLYLHLKAEHDAAGRGPFPPQKQILNLIGAQRRARNARGAPAANPVLRGVKAIPLAARVNKAGELPQSKVGHTFTKLFPGYGKFVGTATIFYPDTGRHHVTYPDGDEEDLDWTELSDLLTGGD